MTLSSVRPPSPNRRLIGQPGSRAHLSTPALVLDIDKLDANIRRMAEISRTAGLGLRPHSKGHKSVEIARRQVKAGACGICCATLGEAEVMVGGEVENVLITSPIANASMVERLVALNAAAKGLMVVADSRRHIAMLEAATAKAGQTLGVIVEFDVGQGRTGTVGEDAALSVIKAVTEATPLRYAGVQAYYGHLQHIATFADRRVAVVAQSQRVRALCARLEGRGLRPGIVTGGGTGTYSIDCEEKVFTEIQPGSYAFLDREYTEVALEEGGGSPFEPSLFVRATVISANHDGLAVVNAGYKSFATEGGPPVVLSPELVEPKYELMGDEHGGIRYRPRANAMLEVGDDVEFLVPYCDPTINLYDWFHCVRGDTLIDIWPVDGRGR
jgi:D-serine deaminase-like pyridoxal phosphate-dependent protein